MIVACMLPYSIVVNIDGLSIYYAPLIEWPKNVLQTINSKICTSMFPTNEMSIGEKNGHKFNS